MEMRLPETHKVQFGLKKIVSIQSKVKSIVGVICMGVYERRKKGGKSGTL